MNKAYPSRHYLKGFTLLEIMMVLVIMGIAAGAIVFNIGGQQGADKLKKQTQRFEVIFNMAADYAILNQRQLGLRVEEEDNTYHFLILDEQQKWQRFNVDKVFDIHTLPEDFNLELSLTDLPWDTDQSLFSGDALFDEELSVSNDGVEIGEKEEKQPDPPQVFIFSSGEITPFSMTLAFEPDFGSELPVYYRINGEDTTPLLREGPLDAP